MLLQDREKKRGNLRIRGCVSLQHQVKQREEDSRREKLLELICVVCEEQRKRSLLLGEERMEWI
jgi:hypothetical protein